MKARLENPFQGNRLTVGAHIAIAGFLACLTALLLLFATSKAQAQVTPEPRFDLIGLHMPTHFTAGSTNNEFVLVAANIGGGPTSGDVTLSATLPVGITPLGVIESDNDPGSPSFECQIDVQVVTCIDVGPVKSSRQLEVRIQVEVDALLSPGKLSGQASISGGGAEDVSIETTTVISPTPPPFGFLAPPEGGPNALLSEADGEESTAAGSHPYQYTTSLGFPTEKTPTGELIGAETVRDVTVDLPRGLIVNPTATPALCTEAELAWPVGNPRCPLGSQVGQVTVITVETTGPKAAPSPLYNMVPPPGEAAMLAFDALQTGVFIHISGSVRSDGDFGLSGATEDALALPLHPVFGARVELWGDPSSDLHDHVRGKCFRPEEACSEPVDQQQDAFITMPNECAGPLVTRFHANSWVKPDAFKEGSHAGSAVDGCNALEFKPAIEAQPTTNLADTPSGFDFSLRQPQDSDLEGLSPAVLKDATVTLPEGLVVNPSAASGQQACGPAQIGLRSGVGGDPVRFSKIPDSCPDAAKIGRIEVKTPLLAEMDESETKAQRDPEGNPIPRPLEGDVYLAEPFQNPFGSLLAIYFAIEDSRSGQVAKFAAEVRADPVTGQLKNVLTESPQLPLEDVSINIFKGPRASLRTPPACATYTTTTDLVPWSAPEGPGGDDPTDSFAIAGAPHGGACPASPEAAPNLPAFVAGTLSPQAGAYSPFLLRVSREDASQPIGGFEATLPPGLTAKLAGVPVCAEAQIAQAKAREAPELGAIEQASPSCPAGSELGSVDVAAGAGPTPFHATGRVYLTGPYKGAPLSVVIITPALAGPFDLGAVVVRTALYVDPKTAKARAVSDPLPTILEGIPLDLRSASLRMDRPQLTLNPTSCEPSSVNAISTSVFGQAAALQSRFQVGGCESLPFRPKLALRLLGGTKRGDHPRLQGVLTAKPGEANIAATSVALPRSEFLDQSRIRTVCTRVQFAAERCPKGAIYGHVKAITPLLDEVLEGPVYLRSSDNELPDAVGVLRGPPQRPIMIEVSARIDSFKRGIRANFEAVPDAPVSKVVVTMRGGQKGLLINSANLCKIGRRARSATVRMVGQNGKRHDTRPVLKNDCEKKRGKGARGARGR